MNSAAPSSVSSIAETPFGEADGQEVKVYTLTNTAGVTVGVMNHGAALTSLRVPDRRGEPADIVLGFDALSGYQLPRNPFFGATVGRVANRIRDGRFTLDGRSHVVATNDDPHHLHGGVKGWDKVVWQAEVLVVPEGPAVRFHRRSPDGEEGYPGAVEAEVIYALAGARNQLRITMRARPDRTTLVNMAHHGYFNLAGEGSGSILDHELLLHAGAYTPGDPVVPTGEVVPVKGTPFDFTVGKAVGRDLKTAGGAPVGFDHNFVVDGPPEALRPVARLKDPGSGRVMTVASDQPGVQFYSGNFLDGTLIGKSGRAYQQYAGLCLETQRFPNAINVPAWRDQVILGADHLYAHHMILEFTTE